jgi:hypothetical protein
VTAEAPVALSAEEAQALWEDTGRWASFIEGFARVIERTPEWPAEGGKVVWETGPSGRGRVTEKVVERSPGLLRAQVFEDRLIGEQAVRFAEGRVGMQLEYELTRRGPLSGVTDVLFIRRAVRDSLRRTLRRFAVEAEDQAGLR